MARARPVDGAPPSERGSDLSMAREAGRPTRFGAGDLLALVILGAIFALFVGRSWLAWGDLDADYGREMFVPLRLSQGDVIYRDVRYPYGPLVPYAHALLFRAWQ